MQLLSIITVNYNDVAGLERTIKSVQEQSAINYEHIIIDGGSTDGSAAFIEQHQEGFSYWVSEPDTGIYNAMNKGIQAAQGDYLLFLNSGDFFFNKEVIYLFMKYLDHIDIVFGNLIKLNNNQQIIDKGPLNKNINLGTFLNGTINHPATFIKSSLFKSYGYYDEDLKIVADWKFFLITIGLNKATTKYIDEIITVFDQNGISSQNTALRNIERNQVLKKELPFMKFYFHLLNTKIKELNWFFHKKFMQIQKYTLRS
jgi:glycosyltransferase involved in cell wall biosynthesis